MASVIAVTGQGGTKDQHCAHGNPRYCSGTEACGYRQWGRCGNNSQRWHRAARGEHKLINVTVRVNKVPIGAGTGCTVDLTSSVVQQTIDPGVGYPGTRGVHGAAIAIAAGHTGNRRAQ